MYGKQCTPVWYVYDNKVSHMEATIVEDRNNDMNKYFEELLVNRVKKHIFLGMNINKTEDQKVEIQMIEQFLEALEAFGENIDE